MSTLVAIAYPDSADGTSLADEMSRERWSVG